ncbi:nuclear pore complex protein NUP62 [Asparagus officinalis]|uniref:nuclear pore complex protein NUP62 n=1 Tax=Asparagus officinalis TaxID=4686 RepID=UPI00098DE83E|nr:nuclear pore complex protein NUP62 [Asparagus officinalis]
MATSPMVLGSDGDDSDVEGSGLDSSTASSDDGEETDDLLLRRFEIGCFFEGLGNGGLDSRQRLVLAADEASDDADGSDEDFKDEEDERRGLGILGSKTQDFGGERREAAAPAAAVRRTFNTTSSPALAPRVFICRSASAPAATTTSSASPLFGTSALISASTSASSSTTSQTLSSTIAASSSGTSASISSTTSQSPKFPSEIVGKNVEEIIKDWNSELQERTTKFRKHAVAIAEWDRRILRNRDVLLRLEAEVAKVVETQAFLEKQLELIETHQQEVDKALQSMEGEAERVYEDERGLLLEDEAAFARDSMYEQAEFIESELQKMAEQIKLIIEKVNAKQGGDLSAIDGMTPIDFVVRILNNQLSSLMWIDEKANEFSTRIKKLASHGTGSDHDMAGSGFWLK